MILQLPPWLQKYWEPVVAARALQSFRTAEAAQHLCPPKLACSDPGLGPRDSTALLQSCSQDQAKDRMAVLYYRQMAIVLCSCGSVYPTTCSGISV